MEEDVQNVTDILVGVAAKLNEEILQFRAEEPGDTTSPEQREDSHHLSERVHLGPDSRSHALSCPMDVQPAADSSSDLDEKGTESVGDSADADGRLRGDRRDKAGETSEKMRAGELIVG